MKPLLICACLASLILGGCAEVKPWQRGELARPEMAFVPDAMQQSLKDHVYFSKEASSGGTTAGGGGCGCN